MSNIRLLRAGCPGVYPSTVGTQPARVPVSVIWLMWLRCDPARVARRVRRTYLVHTQPREGAATGLGFRDRSDPQRQRFSSAPHSPGTRRVRAPNAWHGGVHLTIRLTPVPRQPASTRRARPRTYACRPATALVIFILYTRRAPLPPHLRLPFRAPRACQSETPTRRVLASHLRKQTFIFRLRSPPFRTSPLSTTRRVAESAGA